jgi:hypothetical protein
MPKRGFETGWKPLSPHCVLCGSTNVSCARAKRCCGFHDSSQLRFRDAGGGHRVVRERGEAAVGSEPHALGADHVDRAAGPLDDLRELQQLARLKRIEMLPDEEEQTVAAVEVAPSKRASGVRAWRST